MDLLSESLSAFQFFSLYPLGSSNLQRFQHLKKYNRLDLLLSLPVTSYLFLFIHFQTSIMKHNLYFHFFTNSLLFKSHLPFYSSSKNCFVKVHKYRLFSLQFLSFFPLTLWSPFYLKLVPLFRFTIQCYLTWSYFSTPFLPLHFWIIFPLLSTHSRS